MPVTLVRRGLLLVTLVVAAVALGATPPQLGHNPRRGPRQPLDCGIGAVPLPPDARAGECPVRRSVLAGYSADDGATIDVMVVYTAAARDAAGGTAAIEALIDTAATGMNDAWANSEINPRVRIVRKALIDYVETGQAALDLPRLVEPADGHLDSVHADRDACGADLASLWVNNLDYGGVAYQLVALGSDEDGRFGFSVLRWDNVPFDIFAHELGHNFGCQHDRENAPNAGFFPYSYGYREPGGVWKDIMAYPPGQTIPHFSNPDVIYNGPLGNPGPTGVPGEDPDASCNNARTIRETAWTLANCRPSTISPAPPARLYVRASAPAGGNGATWDTAFNELQHAIGVAVRARGAVTEIWVAAGTYRPDLSRGDRLMSFRLVDGVAIYGGFAGHETQLSQRNPGVNVATLSGDIGAVGDPSDNSYHVLDVLDLSPTAVLDGFTISAGHADGAWPHDRGGGLRDLCGAAVLRNCRFTGNAAWYAASAYCGPGATTSFVECTFENAAAVSAAGGLACENSSPSLTRCAFSGLSAANHAALDVASNAAPVVSDCTFSNNSADWGGAIGVYAASATLTACTLAGNASVNGGGGLVAGGGATLTLNGCTFESNSADFGGGAYFHSGAHGTLVACDFIANAAPAGGGLYLYAAGPLVQNCLFQRNTAGSDGSGLGGALASFVGSHPQIVDCTFDANAAGCCGGAIVNDGLADVSHTLFTANQANFGAALWNSAANPTVAACRFLGNNAQYAGGAVHNSDASGGSFFSCEFSGNTAADGDGGAVSNVSGSAPAFVNCTLAGNHALWLGGGFRNDATAPTLSNLVCWGNSDVDGAGELSQLRTTGASATIRYSIVQGWTGALGGVANSGADPALLDADGLDDVAGTLDDDLRLAVGSPAIDAGDSAALPGGATTDVAGLPRRVDDPATPDTGVGPPPVVDIGANEFQAPCLPCDANCDGSVNGQDIEPFRNLLLGAPACGPCTGDANGDGSINGQDIAPFVQCLVGP